MTGNSHTSARPTLRKRDRPAPLRVESLDDCVDRIVARAGRRLVVGAPLGIGKPNPVINALYRRAIAQSDLDLTLVTALSLGRPVPRNEIERRFLEPFSERHFGEYPELEYVEALRRGELPPNVHISEFYFASGQFLGVEAAQRRYISSNYTHVARDMVDMGINVILQLVARQERPEGMRYSLSSNPDLTLDVVDLAADRERPLVVAQISRHLPFMHGDAVVEPSFFDLVLDLPEIDFEPFAIPKTPVGTADYLIGIQASTLMRDGGTLQVGIGSLGDAFVYATQLRHEDNATYREVLSRVGMTDGARSLMAEIGGADPFDSGLYGASEMFMDGFIHLYSSGILKRRVYDDEAIQDCLNRGEATEAVTPAWLGCLLERDVISPLLTDADVAYLRRFGIFKRELRCAHGRLELPDGRTFPPDLADPANRRAIEHACLGKRLAGGILMHGAFLLGSKDFYGGLLAMSEEEHEAFCMTRVSKVNQLYGDEPLEILQRRDARFINSAMKMTLLGAAVSDGLENGQVVSGVGGQYNFVAMAHALPGGRSILMFRSTRGHGRTLESNVVWNYGHVTIPRHLRDIAVSEYGVADLRGRTDEGCIAAMLNIADSRYQPALLSEAKRAGKLAADYRIPEACTGNLPAALEEKLAPFRSRDFFAAYPYGSDFTAEEQVLARALRNLERRTSSPWGKVSASIAAMSSARPQPREEPYLKRMGLAAPNTLRERILRRLIARELKQLPSV